MFKVNFRTLALRTWLFRPAGQLIDRGQQGQMGGHGWFIRAGGEQSLTINNNL